MLDGHEAKVLGRIYDGKKLVNIRPQVNVQVGDIRLAIL